MRYPLATLWYEAQLVRERVNAQISTETALFHAVVTSIVSPKNGNEYLRGLLRKLEDSGR